MSKVTSLLFDPNGPFGLNDGFYQNAVAEVGGFLLALIIFSIAIPAVIDWRQARKGKPARENFGQELLLLHVAFGEAVLRFVRTPAGPPRERAADAVYNAFRAFANLAGLFGYAMTADLSREVNDYMRLLRSVRDWGHEAAYPQDLAFATIERRVKRTRDMFAQVNKEFKDVLDLLGVGGYDDVRWSDEMIAEFAGAFDASQREAQRRGS